LSKYIHPLGYLTTKIQSEHIGHNIILFMVPYLSFLLNVDVDYTL